ncbi:hypothetical protein D3C78_1564990 [compost metagenome]
MHALSIKLYRESAEETIYNPMINMDKTMIIDEFIFDKIDIKEEGYGSEKRRV